MAIWVTPLITPTIDTDAYTDKDAIGTPVAITSVPEQGVIESISVIDDSDTGGELTLHFFEDAITGVADNAAWAPTDAEMLLYLGSVTLDAGPGADGTWWDHNTSQSSCVKNIGLAYRTVAGTLYMQMQATDTVHNYGATDDLHIRIGIVY